MNDFKNNEETLPTPTMKSVPVVVRAQASKATGSAGSVFSSISPDEQGWNSISIGMNFLDATDQHVALEIESDLDGDIDISRVRSIRIHVAQADGIRKLTRFYNVLDFLRKEVKARIDAHKKNVIEFYDRKRTLSDPDSPEFVMESIMANYEIEVIHDAVEDDDE